MSALKRATKDECRRSRCCQTESAIRKQEGTQGFNYSQDKVGGRSELISNRKGTRHQLRPIASFLQWFEW